ncbi:27465_t:CDS:1, partial [Racocetra persica]
TKSSRTRSNLEQKIRELEIQNRELLRKLEATKNFITNHRDLNDQFIHNNFS